MSTPSRWQFHQVAGPFGLTEGPAWDGEALLFSNLPNSRILRYHPQTQKTEIYRLGTRLANGLMLDRRGCLFACEAAGRCIACYHRDGSRTVIADSFQGKRLNSPNDLAIDTKGPHLVLRPRLQQPLGRGHRSAGVGTQSGLPVGSPSRRKLVHSKDDP